MNLFLRIRTAIQNIFRRKTNPKPIVSEQLNESPPKNIASPITVSLPEPSNQASLFQEEIIKVPITPNYSKGFFTKDEFSMLPAPKSENALFFPNRGELDPTVSTISNGREENVILTYQHEDFAKKYGHLTTDLGYGLIYSIIHNAYVNEDRTLKSALREAIVLAPYSLHRIFI